jgi:hypothetical protein
LIDNQIVAAAVAAVPTMITVLIGILISNARLNEMNARLGELRSHMDTRFNDVDRRSTENDRNMDRRFDDVKETWRAELHRVEEVLDARLKHLEER